MRESTTDDVRTILKQSVEKRMEEQPALGPQLVSPRGGERNKVYAHPDGRIDPRNPGNPDEGGENNEKREDTEHGVILAPGDAVRRNDLHVHIDRTGVLSDPDRLPVRVVLDDPSAVEFREVCLVKRVVDTVANVLRCRRLTGLPFGDGLCEIIQGRRADCALEVFDDLPPAFVAKQVVNLRFSKLSISVGKCHV